MLKAAEQTKTHIVTAMTHLCSFAVAIQMSVTGLTEMENQLVVPRDKRAMALRLTVL